MVPQPEAAGRPRLAWWWDGSDHGELWAWLLALAGAVVAFSLAALATAGGSPVRGVALANLQTGLGVGLAPTLVALRGLDRARRGGGEREGRRAAHRSLVVLGLAEEGRPAGRRGGRLPPLRPAWWYRVLVGCWAGFVLLALGTSWVTAKRLFTAPDPAQLGVGIAMIALPVLLAWLLVGLVALGKAARVAHWRAASAKAGRTARAPRQPLGRRLAAGPRRVAGMTMVGWRGLVVGVAAAVRWVAGATVVGWRGLVVGVAAAARWVAVATVAGWRWLEVSVPPAARRAADAAATGWRWLEVGGPPAARRAADATLARWHGIQFGLAAAARPAAAATLEGLRGLKSGVAARATEWSDQPLGRRLADDGRRGAGVTLARWRGPEGGSRR